jgi:hypothetical protein
MTLSSAWMIKGWLIAKDAPMEVLHAANDVIRSMKDIALLAARKADNEESELDEPDEKPAATPSPPLPLELPRDAEELAERIVNSLADSLTPESVERVPAAELPKPKQKRKWSPEARAAAAERMRARRAKKTQAPDPGEAPAPSAMSGGAT